MAMPVGTGILDLMVGLPAEDRRWWAKSMAPLLHDDESRRDLQHPAGYMYTDLPGASRAGDPISELIGELDRFGIDHALVPVSFDDQLTIDAVTRHPGRLLGSFQVDPNGGTDELRLLERAVAELGVKAATFFPAGCVPQVAINDGRAFSLYATCVELDIPIFVNAGVPGPRVPMGSQFVGLAEEVCWTFPDLRFVFRHGCEPWEDLAVKLMLKWPNLYYSTSAFAPKHYPKAIIDYANTRGADKVMYAGYHPYGLTLERIFAELPHVPFKDQVWPKFLGENARRVLKLDTT